MQVQADQEVFTARLTHLNLSIKHFPVTGPSSPESLNYKAATGRKRALWFERRLRRHRLMPLSISSQTKPVSTTVRAVPAAHPISPPASSIQRLRIGSSLIGAATYLLAGCLPTEFIGRRLARARPLPWRKLCTSVWR